MLVAIIFFQTVQYIFSGEQCKMIFTIKLPSRFKLILPALFHTIFHYKFLYRSLSTFILHFHCQISKNKNIWNFAASCTLLLRLKQTTFAPTYCRIESNLLGHFSCMFLFIFFHVYNLHLASKHVVFSHPVVGLAEEVTFTVNRFSFRMWQECVSIRYGFTFQKEKHIFIISNLHKWNFLHEHSM